MKKQKRLTRNFYEMQTWLSDLIWDYCKRHNIDVFEINYSDRYVAYVPNGNEFWDYETFDYLKVDLFN